MLRSHAIWRALGHSKLLRAGGVGFVVLALTNTVMVPRAAADERLSQFLSSLGEQFASARGLPADLVIALTRSSIPNYPVSLALLMDAYAGKVGRSPAIVLP